MNTPRSFTCGKCGKIDSEKQYGAGMAGWIQIMGVGVNGVDHPMFCGECKITIMVAVCSVVDKGDN